MKTIKINSGQTLVLLLVYVVVAMIVVTSAVTISIVNSQATNKVYQGTTVRDIAESGAETALLKLLRDPNYSGETLTVENGTATITVTGSTIKTITSVGVLGDFRRTIRAVAEATNSAITVSAWEEI